MYSFGKTLPRPEQSLANYFTKDYVLWQNCADDTLVKLIDDLGESLVVHDAKIGASAEAGSFDQQTRVSSVSWIHHNDDSKFLFDFLIDKIDRINYHNYGMNLFGMEEIQFTRYPQGGHYKYHNDIIVSNNSMRKLSIVLALTDDSEYTGGEFLLMPHGQNPQSFKFKKGDLIAFPSWIPHKVEPVIEGTRKTAVTWVYGPTFV